MNIGQWLYVTLMIIGIGLFCGFIFPCLNGPFNILKFLREKIGKPFACPTCSLLWGIIVAGGLVFFIPLFFYMILGSVGWGVLLMHVSGFQPFYQGMEDE